MEDFRLQAILENFKDFSQIFKDFSEFAATKKSIELKIRSLLERWNAQADKKKLEIVRLMASFRPDKNSRTTFFRSVGSIAETGPVRSAVSDRSGTDFGLGLVRRCFQFFCPDLVGPFCQIGLIV